MSNSNEKSMNNLTAGWYNTIVTALGLDDSSFQLIQGSLPLGDTSVPLFQMSDSVPPQSVTTYFSTSEWNRFSSDYKELLFAMSPGDSANDLKKVLGDTYAVWVSYRTSFYDKNPDSTKSQEDLFKIFANQHLDPGPAQQAILAFQKSEISPVNDAITAFLDQSNYLQGEPIYNQTIEQIKTAILSGQSAPIAYDSKTADSDVTNTWAEGAVGGLIEFFDFEAEAGGTYEAINTKASSSEVTISGTISKYVTVPIGPGKWFDSGVFNNAYKSKDNNYVWDVASQTTWETCFGPSGMMPRVITSLIIVDGIDITITSKASYSSEEYSKITQESEGGFFPFFMAESESTHTSDVKHNADATITVTHKSNIGNPQILGVNVKDVEDAFNN